MAMNPKRKTARKATRARSQAGRASTGQATGRLCFVLMPFKEPFNTYYERVHVPAIKEAGLEPKRVDELFRAGPVTRDIWEHVVSAQLLVAELTDRNANVFYELGLAHAVGRPVVLVTQNLDDVPFDLRHLRMLVYNTVDPDWGPKLQRDLTKGVTETLRDPAASLAFPPVTAAARPESAGTKTVAGRSRATPARGQPVSASSDLSSQFGLQMFSALPADSKIRLMELALSGKKPTLQEMMEVFLEALRGQSDQS
jgi:hypothetical protein